MKKVFITLTTLLLVASIFAADVSFVKASTWENFFFNRSFFTRVYLNLFANNDKTSVGFDLFGQGLKNYKKATYLVIFDSNAGKQAIKGQLDINGRTNIRVNNLYLGYCSTGGTCVSYQGVHNVSIEVTLIGHGKRILWDYIRI